MAGFGNAYISVTDNFFDKTNSSKELLHKKVYSGHVNYLGAASLDFAIKFLQNNNFNLLIKKKKKLSGFLRNELDKLGLIQPIVKERNLHSDIFNIPANKKTYEELLKNRIRCALRGNGVRVSVHFYNNKDDVEKLIKFFKN